MDNAEIIALKEIIVCQDKMIEAQKDLIATLKELVARHELTTTGNWAAKHIAPAVKA